MTTHTLHIDIAKDYEPYARYRLVCSDNGGPGCADGAPADDCEYLREAKERYLREAVGAPLGDVMEDWEADKAHLSLPCDDLWFEGEHYHYGDPGSGCYLVAWFDADPSCSWGPGTDLHFEMPVTVSWHGEDEPLAIRPVRQPDDEPT